MAQSTLPASNSKAAVPTTIQAGISALATIAITHFFPTFVNEAILIGNVIGGIITWIGVKVIARQTADELAEEPVRQLKRLRAEIEEEIAAMDANDPRLEQRLRHAAGLSEEIYNRTVETQFVLVSNPTIAATPIPTQLPPSQ